MNNYKDDDFEARRREIMQKRAAGKKKRKAAAMRRGIIFASIMLVIVLIVLSLTVFFPISSIKVSGGDNRYSKEQIIEATGIKVGENIWMSGADAEEKLTQKLPYIYSADIERKFPSSVVIKIKMATPKTCYKDNKNLLLLCDSNNKVLEVLKKTPDNVPLILGMDIKNTKAGAVVQFNNEEKQKIVEQIRTAVENKSMSLNHVDISNTVDIKIKVLNRFTVKLGSVSSLEDKIEHLSKTIEKIEKNRKGTIDLSDFSDENRNGIFVAE